MDFVWSPTPGSIDRQSIERQATTTTSAHPSAVRGTDPEWRCGTELLAGYCPVRRISPRQVARRGGVAK